MTDLHLIAYSKNLKKVLQNSMSLLLSVGTLKVSYILYSNQNILTITIGKLQFYGKGADDPTGNQMTL